MMQDKEKVDGTSFYFMCGLSNRNTYKHTGKEDGACSGEHQGSSVSRLKGKHLVIRQGGGGADIVRTIPMI